VELYWDFGVVPFRFVFFFFLSEEDLLYLFIQEVGI